MSPAPDQVARTVTHQRSGARFRVPADWEVLGEGEPADDVIAIEPDGSGGFRTNLVLTVVDNADLDFATWQDLTERTLPGMLEDYLLLDRARAQVAGHPGGRRLAHHLAPGGAAVTMEQWFTLVDGVGYTLTATCADDRYDASADLWAAVAEDLTIPGGAR